MGKGSEQGLFLFIFFERENDMVITVYDWNNKAKFIDVPVESAEGVASIDIRIISGDETGVITLKDGTEISFDASDDRIMNYYDG